MNNKHERLTQDYSTWGDKLLQHTDVLYNIQHHGVFAPVTIQLSLCEACDSDCPFCSVANRPIKSSMPFELVEQCLRDFRSLGAKSVELTGGGNPILYHDKKKKKNINDVIRLAHSLSYDIGVITNSSSLKRLDNDTHDMIDWIRISLIKLDEGVEPEGYDFCGFPVGKLGFSYIIYDKCESSPIHGKKYNGTTEETIKKIARLVELYGGEIKFVRFAGDCLIKGNNADVSKQFKDIVDAHDKHGKFFIKTIDEDDDPFDDGCYVGLIRPYVAPSPEGDEYLVYTCTSFVLNTRTYDRRYALCSVTDIPKAWKKMNKRYRRVGRPYEVNGNGGCCWTDTCKHCFYKFNNKLLHTVAHEMPNKNFP